MEPIHQMEDEDNNGIRDYEIYLEQEIVVMLRDGRYLYGIMKSFDQFNSITLDSVIEKIFHENRYSERKHGLFVIRGENISIMGLGSSEVNGDFIMEDFNILNDEISKSLMELQIV